jgi:solute carrier family 25 citrate transporter 1
MEADYADRIDDAKGQKRFRGGAHAFTTLFRENGLPGIYRGLLPTVLKQSATSAVRMGSYNVLREYGKQYQLPDNSLVTFATGAIAGIITVYATQPLDTLKTRYQGVSASGGTGAIRDILYTSGVRGFWRGSTMRLGRLVLSGGIVFTVYENIISLVRPMINQT